MKVLHLITPDSVAPYPFRAVCRDCALDQGYDTEAGAVARAQAHARGNGHTVAVKEAE